MDNCNICTWKAVCSYKSSEECNADSYPAIQARFRTCMPCKLHTWPDTSKYLQLVNGQFGQASILAGRQARPVILLILTSDVSLGRQQQQQ
jgi:hypothetical protein